MIKKLFLVVFLLPPLHSEAKVFSFKDPVGTSAIAGKIHSTLVVDTITHKQLPTPDNPIYYWMITRDFYNCKTKSHLSLYQKYWFGLSEPTETFPAGAPLGIPEAIFPTNLSIKASTNGKPGFGYTQAIQSGCKNPPKDWQDAVHLTESARNGNKYGEGKVHAFTPSRLRVAGDEREAWYEVSLVDLVPEIDKETAATLNIAEDKIGAKHIFKRVQTRTKYMIRCRKMQMAVRQFIEYDKDGKIDSSANRDKATDADFLEVIPGSVGESFAEFVCSL